jgi:hypothetical protein
MTCTRTDVTKPERSQRQFVALCQCRSITYGYVIYQDFLKFLNLHTLHNRRLYFDALIFFISVYSGLKCSLSLLTITGIRGLPRTFRNSYLFTVTCYNAPLAGCVQAADSFGKDVDIFKKSIFLQPILH